jgi:heme-degrading monooxygenase HmoA
MIAVLFEAKAEPAHQARYLQLAAELKPLLADIDGFIDIERFQSLTTDGKILSLSWWRDEEAIRNWKQNVFHQAAQAEGRGRFLRTTAFAWRSAGIQFETGGHAMYDVHVIFSDMPGELARFGQLLGRTAWGWRGRRIWYRCPFLVEDGEKPDACCWRPGLPCRQCRLSETQAGAAGELGDIAAVLAARGVSIYPVQRPCESPYSADG